MAITQSRSLKKPTGGRFRKHRKKKKRDIGSDFLAIKIGKDRRKVIRVLGGNKKMRLLQSEKVNVTDPSTKEIKSVKIIAVKENAANPHFVRMNVITKGAIIETDLGNAKVTNRPGQEGFVNAVLVGQG